MTPGIRKTKAGLKIGRVSTDKIGLYGTAPTEQAAVVAAAKVNYTTGDLDAEAEIIAALNTTNGKINSILTALKNIGIIASS